MSEDTPVQTVADNWSYRLVVGGLVAVLLGIIAGYITLPFIGKDAPTELSQMAIAIIGGLIGILSPIRK